MRATRRPKRDATVERFEIVCPCGQSFRGVRTAEAQALECDICGGRLFVLPECRYPDVDAPQSAGDAPAVAGSPSATPAARVDRKKRKRKKGGQRSDRKSRDEKPAARPATESAAETQTPQQPAAPPGIEFQERRRFVTWPRTVLALMLICTAATGYWMYRRNAIHRAEQSFRDRSDAGFAALKEADLLTARREFRDAVVALDELQRDDAKSRQVRQLAQECEAATALLDVPLHEILAEAEDAENAGENWGGRFERQYAGRWVILDAAVRRSPESGGLTIDYPLAVANRPVVVDGGLEAFGRLTVDEQPRRAVFAAQLQSCKLTDEASPSWVVRFDPETAFLWSHGDILQTLGLAVDEEMDDGPRRDNAAGSELQQRLQHQSRLLGLEETE